MTKPSINHPIKRFARELMAKTRQQLQHQLLGLLVLIRPPWQFALRNFLFTVAPTLFTETSSFQNWQEAKKYFDQNRSRKIQIIDLQKISTPKLITSKKIAIHAHIFYSELAPELAQLLTDFPAPFDLLISTPEPQNESLLRSQFQRIANLEKLQILITPNRGRDLGPMLYGFGKELLNYDYFAHIHTKKSSATNEIGDAWRQYLVQGLLDSSQGRMLKILDLLEKYGLVYPQKFPLIDVQNCQWGDNLKAASALCNQMHIAVPVPGYIEFPAGSMFWAKVSALKPLLELPLTFEDFEQENGQTDRTVMHAIERSLTHICLAQGYPVALLSHPSPISFYP
jgi:lipopolysaccharide biosynthesis protein